MAGFAPIDPSAILGQPQTRNRLIRAMMGSDPSAQMDPAPEHRIADDLPGYQAPAPGSTGDLESRATSSRMSLADQLQKNQTPAAPSRLDQLQTQYDTLQAPQPKKESLAHKILMGVLVAGGGGAGAARGLQQKQQAQEFEEGRYDRQRQSLAQQIEAEQRLQEQNQLQDQRDTSAYQRQLDAQREMDFRQAPKTLDTDQGPMQWDMNSRQWSPITRNGQPVGPKAQPKPDTEFQQFSDSPEERGKPFPQIVAEYAAATQKPEQPQRPPQQLAITPDNKVIDLKPGMTIPKGTQSFQGQMKQEQSDEGKTTAINYANDYLNRGMFTGPGDEALMEKFFEMAKPTSGFRMTQAQMDMLKNAQSWGNSLTAKARHATVGTWFSDEQRQQIVDTMNQLGRSGPRAGKSQGGPTVGAIEDGYRFKGGNAADPNNWEPAK
jgi:hypothetical protein